MAQNSIYLKSNAKINLCLDVVGKRDDGYHDLVSIMQTISLHDVIYIKKIYKENYFKLVTNFRHLPTDEKNIVYRAIKILMEKYDVSTGLFIDIKKTIPVSAGLGGGSSNCAAAINAIKELFSLPISRQEAMDIGKSLGADVPFFFVKGTALAEGIGEILTPLPALPNCWFVLVRPPVVISTADVFKKFRLEDKKDNFDVEKMKACLVKSDIYGVCDTFYNALEGVTAQEYPIIHQLKEELLMHGAIGALMSGSGPTVFGCFATKIEAIHALNAIKKKHENIKEIFITRNV